MSLKVGRLESLKVTCQLVNLQPGNPKNGIDCPVTFASMARTSHFTFHRKFDFGADGVDGDAKHSSVD